MNIKTLICTVLLSSAGFAGARDANFTLNVAGVSGYPTGIHLSSTLLHAFGLNDAGLKLNLRAGADLDFSGNYAVNLDALAALEGLDFGFYGGSTLRVQDGSVRPGATAGASLFVTDRFDLFLEGAYVLDKGLSARAGVAIRF